MAFRRYKAKARRRTGGGYRKRKTRVYKMFRRPRVAGKNNLYFYKQAIDGSLIPGISARTITQGASAQHYPCEFRVSNIPNWNALTALYDQFCLTKVVLKLMPIVNVNGVQPLAGSTLLGSGLIGSIIDIDDAVALSNITDYEQYQSWRCQPAISQKTHTRVVVPGMRAASIGTGGAVQPALSKKKQWLDCAYGNTAHFGIKLYLDAYGNFNAPAQYQVMATYYLKFRNVR